MSGTPVALETGAAAVAVPAMATLGAAGAVGGALGAGRGTPEADVDADVTQRRAAEARVASVALGTAAGLSLIRATVLPFVLAAAPKEQFASFVSPEVRTAHWALAAVFVAAFLCASRRPLHASVAALLIYLAWAVPDILHNPVLVGGGHIGKVVTVGILARAAFAGVMHHLLKFERAR